MVKPASPRRSSTVREMRHTINKDSVRKLWASQSLMHELRWFSIKKTKRARCWCNFMFFQFMHKKLAKGCIRCTVEARPGEARIACVSRAWKWGRKLATFTSMCAQHCKAPIRPHLRAFRGLPRPHSWGFEAFRGLARPRQNRKTPLACKITRPRRLELT